MYSVTARIKNIKQPRGGYINKNKFQEINLEDGKVLNEVENISPGLVGIAVDYLTRWMMGVDIVDAFEISLIGATVYDQFAGKGFFGRGNAIKKAKKLLTEMRGLDDRSITNACKLAGFDVCYRVGVAAYKPIEEIEPDQGTIENIRTMVERSLEFWKMYGPIVKDGFTFEGGYTDTISSGDGDYLSQDTLWDFKVTKNEIKPQQTLQLLVYYIMGMHSKHKEFKTIRHLGLFNPRKNKIYIANIDDIPREVIDEVSSEVIGYK